MVLGAILGSVLGSAASAGVSKLFGGGSSGSGSGSGGSAGLMPASAGGLDVRYNKGLLQVLPSTSTKGPDPRTTAVNNISKSYLDNAAYLRSIIPQLNNIFGQDRSKIDAIMAQVEPGYGALTDARVNAIRDKAMSSGSDLRGNLARRRVLGSSFGNDAMTRNDAEFAKQEAEARAASFLEELDVKTKLIDRQLETNLDEINGVNSFINSAFSFERAADENQLNELNKQLSVMTGILNSAMQMQQANARAEQEGLLRQGSAFGGLASSIGDQAGGFFSGLFSGGQAAPTWATNSGNSFNTGSRGGSR